MPELLNAERAALADQLERSFRGGAWHGPAIIEMLAGVDARLARQRPAGGGHSIFELVGHITFWLDTARKRIAGEEDRSPEDAWPSVDDGSDEAWAAVLETLERSHCQLRGTVRDLDDDRLDDTVSHADPTVRGLLLGILQHNAYHAGQIMQIVKAAGGSER